MGIETDLTKRLHKNQKIADIISAIFLSKENVAKIAEIGSS